jgi:hypothetical protein
MLESVDTKRLVEKLYLLQLPVESSESFDGKLYGKEVHFQAISMDPNILRSIVFLHIVWI